MKLNAALAKSLLLAASIGMVVPVLADTTVVKTTPDTSTPPRPVPIKPVAAKPAAAKPPKGTAADAAKKKEAEEIILPGIIVTRPDGGLLTVEVEAGKFKISFFDKDKKPITPEIARGIARWDSNKKIHQERTVLNPSDDGKILRGVEFVSPPYTFKLFITLLDNDGKAVENHVIQMTP